MATAEHFQTSTESADALQRMMDQLDACFLNGFVGGQYEILDSLPRIFAGTPLEARMQASIAALLHNEFLESHFVTLAAARCALLGTLYDALRDSIRAALGRPPQVDAPDLPHAPSSTDPLLDSVRHWLMELALSGYARLEPGVVVSFATTLAPLRARPDTASQGAALTGFFHELLEAQPIKDPDQVPLRRWCDLWSVSMLNAVGAAESPTPTPISGILYPLGVQLRQHSRMASITVCSVLVNTEGARFVRQTWSSFKVAAIQGDELWLLFPEAQPLLQGLLQGKSLTLTDMPILPSGDLRWKADAAALGKKFKLLDIAGKYCAPETDLLIPAMPPLERHPIQLAEPIVFTDYQVEDGYLRLKDGSTLALDRHTSALSAEILSATTELFGLLHYDAGEWYIQALTAGSPAGKYEFVGQIGVSMLVKPPKAHTVSILRERAGRLLRRTS